LENLNAYSLARKQAERAINNRHLYVAYIMQNLFDPEKYHNICEIGGGRELELAHYLANIYKQVIVYEPNDPIKPIAPNLQLYSKNFTGRETLQSNVFVSVCPYLTYYYDEEHEYDEIDRISSEEVQNKIIVPLINSQKEFFIVLSNRDGMEKVADNIIQQYSKLVTLSDIDLNERQIEKHKVLIYKKTL